MTRTRPPRRRFWLLVSLASLSATLIALGAGSSPSSAARAASPATNPPNELTATGQAQTATIEGRYPEPLQAQLLDAVGQPIEGATVTFAIIPSPSGAGAAFLPVAGQPGGSGGGTAGQPGGGSQAAVLTDTNGVAVAPPLIANDTPGHFTATATSSASGQRGDYELRNLPAKIAATATRSQTGQVDEHYRKPLRAHVTDQHGHPIDGATVTFTITAGATGATAGFPGGGNQFTATTGPTGVATSPQLTANDTAGSFTAAAAIAGTLKPAAFALRNYPGAPAMITAGAASGESTVIRSTFRIRLAVTVTDHDGNPVPHTIVSFAAAAHGASGRFTTHSKKERVIHVTTDGAGIAVAPPFTANTIVGGYIVPATTEGNAHAAFALMNITN